jgi:hypothetical protein
VKAIALLVVLAASGHALAITPVLAVLLVLGGILLATLACVGIIAIVRLTGARPAHLLDRSKE